MVCSSLVYWRYDSMHIRNGIKKKKETRFTYYKRNGKLCLILNHFFFSFTTFLNFDILKWSSIRVLLWNEINASIFRIYKLNFSFETSSRIEPATSVTAIHRAWILRLKTLCSLLRNNFLIINFSVSFCMLKKINVLKKYLFRILRRLYDTIKVCWLVNSIP